MYVKICGLTQLEQAAPLVRTGVDAIGINLHPSSPRRVSFEQAGELLAAVRREAAAAGRPIELVALLAASQGEQAISRCRELGFDWVQLHGAEGDGGWSQRVASARAAGAESQFCGVFRAVGIGSEADLELAARSPGERVLLDAKVPGQAGGTGQRFDWRLARELSARRRVILAGGLTPENVAEAIRVAAPWGVDAASSLEVSPGVKDLERCRAFAMAARGAGVSEAGATVTEASRQTT